jgi:hypothetical protein
VDPNDGTVIDNQTGLMWEKKVTGGGCLHCVNDDHSWANGMSQFISEVNGFTDDPNAQAGLGGHSDWRIPNIVELLTILDCGFGPPCIDPIFGPTATWYWTSSTLTTSAWNVLFTDGEVSDRPKGDTVKVRAVRGP